MLDPKKKISFKISDWNWSSMPKGAAEICNIIDTIFTVEREPEMGNMLCIFWFKNGPTVHAAPLQKCGTTTPRSHHCVSLLKKSIRCLAILTVKRFCGFFSNMQQQQLWKSLQICTHTYAYPGNLTSTIWRLLIHIQIAAAYCCFCHWELVLREIERKYY